MVENGTGPGNSAERSVNGTRRDEDMAEAGDENENEDNENDEEEEEDDDDDDDHEGPYTPFDLPSKKPLHSCGVCLDMLESIAGTCRGRGVSESFHQLSRCSEAPGHM